MSCYLRYYYALRTKSMRDSPLSDAIVLNQNVTYAELKTLLNEIPFGTEDKRKLKSKLRSFACRKGINRNVFMHDLETCIKEIYGITDFQTVNAAAKNYVVNNLDEYLRRVAKLFRLHSSPLES